MKFTQSDWLTIERRNGVVSSFSTGKHNLLLAFGLVTVLIGSICIIALVTQGTSSRMFGTMVALYVILLVWFIARRGSVSDLRNRYANPITILGDWTSYAVNMSIVDIVKFDGYNAVFEVSDGENSVNMYQFYEKEVAKVRLTTKIIYATAIVNKVDRAMIQKLRIDKKSEFGYRINALVVDRNLGIVSIGGIFIQLLTDDFWQNKDIDILRYMTHRDPYSLDEKVKNIAPAIPKDINNNEIIHFEVSLIKCWAEECEYNSIGYVTEQVEEHKLEEYPIGYGQVFNSENKTRMISVNNNWLAILLTLVHISLISVFVIIVDRFGYENIEDLLIFYLGVAVIGVLTFLITFKFLVNLLVMGKYHLYKYKTQNPKSLFEWSQQGGVKRVEFISYFNRYYLISFIGLCLLILAIILGNIEIYNAKLIYICMLTSGSILIGFGLGLARTFRIYPDSKMLVFKGKIKEKNNGKRN